MAVNRSTLAQALSQGTKPGAYLSASDDQRDLLNAEGISQFALDSKNFGSGQAGAIGLAAQLATAGIGAFAQNRARKEIAEKEVASQQAFAQNFPEYADLAGQLTPESRQAYTMEILKSRLPKSAENQIISGEGGYFAVDKNNPASQAQPVIGPDGQIVKPQKPASTTINVGEQQSFKNATQLRGEFADRSKTFAGVKENYEKTQESLADPSPAGDIATVFSFIKTLDPASTVREGEFAQLENAKPILEKYGLQKFENVWSGKRLTPTQRADIAERSKKLYERAYKSQQRLSGYYTDIAKRNNLNPQDIISDFSTTIQPDEQLSEQEQARAILKKRGKLK